MAKIWNGVKRIAFVPVWNNKVDTQPPGNWSDTVRSRVFYDPDPNTGLDRSLQRYIQTVSSGTATVEGFVFPTVEANDEDTVGAALQSLPPSHNYDYAVAVLPHSMGPHRNGFAWWGETPNNNISNYARVAMFTDMALSQRQNIGVWAMEVLHIVTEFGDLYNVSPQLGRFDSMACACGTHLSAHTKSSIGWLDAQAVQKHQRGASAGYTLHAISLPQPPPYWRKSAIRIEAEQSLGHFIIEARLELDQYDGSSIVSGGIPSEGVIVYEVQGETQVFLRTSPALQVGEKFEDTNERITVRVSDAVEGGFVIRVEVDKPNVCERLNNTIMTLQQALEIETDFQKRKQLISAIAQAQADFRRLNCNILDEGVFAPITPN
jgi:hypothetical protein